MPPAVREFEVERVARVAEKGAVEAVMVVKLTENLESKTGGVECDGPGQVAYRPGDAQGGFHEQQRLWHLALVLSTQTQRRARQPATISARTCQAHGPSRPAARRSSRGTLMFDLDRYLERIAYRGGTACSAATLVALHEAHAGAIPFENLDVLAGRTISVDPPDVAAKLVGARRGGYCYEQATLFQSALEALGFASSAQLARVRWTDARRSPRSHLVLEVDTPDGPYLADVGFGGRGLLHPLPLAAEAIHQTPDGARYRFAPQPDGGWFLDGDLGGGWEPHYALYRTPVTREDVFMANYYVSTHPASMFRHVLMVQRITPERRSLLVNRSLKVTQNARTVVHELTDAAALRATLESEFALVLPPGWAPPPSPDAPGPGPDRPGD